MTLDDWRVFVRTATAWSCAEISSSFLGRLCQWKEGRSLLFFYPGNLTGREVCVCFLSRFAVEDGHDARS
jgi:hypothetical protein